MTRPFNSLDTIVGRLFSTSFMAGVMQSVKFSKGDVKMLKSMCYLLFGFMLSSLAYGNECSYLNSIAQDKSRKVDERYEAAKQYKSCLFSIANPENSQEIFAIKSTPFVQEAEAQEEELGGVKKFLGQNFGVGFGVSFYDDEIVDDADVVNGIVVAKSRKREEARVLLEFHTLIACTNGGTSTDFGCGPFAAIAAKNDDILGGIGVGWLWSWRNKSSNDGAGFSIGIGAIVDNDVKDLADGFEVGSVPPNGETVVRYTDETKASYLLFISNTF